MILIEQLIIFEQKMFLKPKGLYKKVAKAPQFLGFNNVILNNHKNNLINNKKMNPNLCQNKQKF